MRFVIGGANGGKRDFVRENYGIDEISKKKKDRQKCRSLLNGILSQA